MGDAPAGLGVDGLAQALELNATRLARLRDLSAPMLAAADAVYGEIQRNFARQGSDDGPWAPLKPKTLAAKLRRGGDSAILIGAPGRGGDAGALMRDWELDSDEDSATVTSLRGYGIYHQLGTARLPVRRITPTRDRAYELLQPVFASYRDAVVADVNAE